MDDNDLQRDIDEKLVQSVIDNPIETIYDITRDNYKSYALVPHPLTNNDAFLMVVHSDKTNIEILIISVMWQTRGGLRQNGSSII
jgi:hypothetical protein